MPSFSIVAAVTFALVVALVRPAGADFPPGFLWGTAISGFQTEMGVDPANDDTNSDWWAWVHDPDNLANDWVSGDFPEDGPGFLSRYADDLHLVRRRVKVTTFRLGLEWSRIFPTSTAGVDTSGGITLATLQQLDALADQTEVARYRAILAAIHAEGMVPFVTLLHYVMPLWAHDPIAVRDALSGIDPEAPIPGGIGPAGWLDAGLVTEFEKYAAYVGWKFGDLADRWAPLNEPVPVAASGYANIPDVLATFFPPGVFTFTGIIAVLTNEIEGHAAAYDALKAWDTADADGDSVLCEVGPVHNMVAFEPLRNNNPDDILGAQHADYLFNRLFLNSIILGQTDPNANGILDPGESRPDLVGKADFVGVNYYFRGKTLGIGGSPTPTIPIFDFLPITSYSTPENPTTNPCPSRCTEFGWEIYPQGLGEVLTTAGSYGLPLYVTENGLADADDDQRASFLVQHLVVLENAIANGLDVRGYFHWSFIDNYEWVSGYFPRFGLFRYDPDRLRPKARRSANTYKRIIRKNAVPPRLALRYPF